MEPESAETGVWRRGTRPRLLVLHAVLVVLIAVTAVTIHVHIDVSAKSCNAQLGSGEWVGKRWRPYHCVMKYYQKKDLLQCLELRDHVIFIGTEPLKPSYRHLKHASEGRPDLVVDMKSHSFLNEETFKEYHLLAETPNLLVVHKPEYLHTDGPELTEICKESNLQQLLNVQYQLVDAGMQKSIHPPPLIVVLPPVAAGDQSPSKVEQNCIQLAKKLYSKLAVYLGVWLIFASGATFVLTPHLEAMSFDLKKFFSICNSIAVITAALFYLLLADRLYYFTKVSIVQTPYPLLMVLVTVIICGVFSRTSSEEVEFLSCEQAQEWRGWMVLTLIALHYTEMDQVLSLKLIGQMLVGAFIFLSSYGHFLYFWRQGELSWRRIFKVLFRLNFLTICVCLTLGTSYGAYYMVALLSGWFLFSCVFLKMWPALTSAKHEGMSWARWMFAFKFISAFVVVTSLPFAEKYFLPLFTLPLVKTLVSHDGSPYQLYYFFYQQRYMALWGLLFGYIVVNVKSSHPSDELVDELKKVGGVMSIPILVVYGLFVFMCSDEKMCSEANAFLSMFPVLAYILVMNSTTLLQNSHSSLLRDFGSFPLWLLVSHHHILLALNGQGLLFFFPNGYYLNLLSVIIVYLFVYQVVGRSTKTLKECLFSKTSPPTVSEP